MHVNPRFGAGDWWPRNPFARRRISIESKPGFVRRPARPGSSLKAGQHSAARFENDLAEEDEGSTCPDFGECLVAGWGHYRHWVGEKK